MPGMVTRLAVRWAPTDYPSNTAPASAVYSFDPNSGHGYVWHCHIIDHEDNEMMRPTSITALVVASGAATANDPLGLTLTDSGASFITAGVTAGMTVRNLSSTPVVSSGVITAVTATTITATLTGGTANSWAVGNSYQVVPTRTYVQGLNY